VTINIINYSNFSCAGETQNIQMAYIKTLEFTSAVRGYHFYRTFWKPEPNQILNCFYEDNNAFDRFAIKVCEFEKENPVGHLPKEISRVTKFLLDRGANLTATLTSEHYRRSPLVQGGLEIPCKIIVTMPGTVSNLLVLEKYRQLVEELYTEPKNEEILGSFLYSIATDQRPPPAAKKNTKSKIYVPPNVPEHKDIRSFFGNAAARRVKSVTKKRTEVETICID